MAKTLCDYKKSELKAHAQKMQKQNEGEILICAKCARVAVDKENVCKPQKWKKAEKKE